MSSSSCFSAQAGAIIATGQLAKLNAVKVLIEKQSLRNIVVNSGNNGDVIMDKTENAFSATPTI